MFLKLLTKSAYGRNASACELLRDHPQGRFNCLAGQRPALTHLLNEFTPTRIDVDGLVAMGFLALPYLIDAQANFPSPTWQPIIDAILEAELSKKQASTPRPDDDEAKSAKVAGKKLADTKSSLIFLSSITLLDLQGHRPGIRWTSTIRSAPYRVLASERSLDRTIRLILDARYQFKISASQGTTYVDVGMPDPFWRMAAILDGHPLPGIILDPPSECIPTRLDDPKAEAAAWAFLTSIPLDEFGG